MFTQLLCGNKAEATFFTWLVMVVIAIRAQYHSCCYQNCFTTIPNTLASPGILQDISVLKSCYLYCETLQHEILSERVHSRSCSGCDGHLLFQEGLGSSLARFWVRPSPSWNGKQRQRSVPTNSSWTSLVPSPCPLHDYHGYLSWLTLVLSGHIHATISRNSFPGIWAQSHIRGLRLLQGLMIVLPLCLFP